MKIINLLLKKLFGLLKVSYIFSPKLISSDYDYSQIKALKICETFSVKPFVICCLFHYSKSLYMKMKKIGIINKNFNKRPKEILRNFEILCFLMKSIIF